MVALNKYQFNETQIIHFDPVGLRELISLKSRSHEEPRRKRRKLLQDLTNAGLGGNDYKGDLTIRDEDNHPYITIVDRELSFDCEAPLELSECKSIFGDQLGDKGKLLLETCSVKLSFELSNSLLAVKNKGIGKMKPKLLVSWNIVPYQAEHSGLFEKLRTELKILSVSSSKLSNSMLDMEGPIFSLALDLVKNRIYISFSYRISIRLSIQNHATLDMLGKLSHLILTNSVPLPLKLELNLSEKYGNEMISPQLFYKCISEGVTKLKDPVERLDIPELETELLRFQKRTVSWLLRKEGMRYDESSGRAVKLPFVEVHLAELIHRYSNGDEIDIEVLDEAVQSCLDLICFGWGRILMNDNTYWFNRYTCNLASQKNVHDFLLEYSENEKKVPRSMSAKGLLAEEMGLGKTVEITALTLLNPRPFEDTNEPLDITLNPFGDTKTIIRAKTNLVIAPDSIIKQWAEEIMNLAPSIAITIYAGIDKYPKLQNNAVLISEYLRKFDIVFTTYSTISRELDYALYSSRNKITRNSKKNNYGASTMVDKLLDVLSVDQTDDVDNISFHEQYRLLFQLSLHLEKPKIANEKSSIDQEETDFERALQDEISLAIKHNKVPNIYKNHEYQSPLMLTQFWRVILDEVQMVSSRLSRAFQSAALIPRHHAWGVSGTPIKKSLQDLHSVLRFLKVQPFIGDLSKNSWSILTSGSNLDFIKLWRRLGFRHTKAMVHEDIKLPPQTRVLLKIPFNPIEQENYNQALEECLAAICLDSNGNPVLGDWEPTPMILGFMRSWLIRLRQLCCNPQIGKLNLNSKNYRSKSYLASRLVSTTQQLKTLEDVLQDMLAGTTEQITNIESQIVQIYVEVAQFLEYVLLPLPALKFLRSGAIEAQKILLRLKLLLDKSLDSFESFRKRFNLLLIQNDTDVDLEDTKLDFGDEQKISSETREKFIQYRETIKGIKGKIRSWNIMLHKFYFLLASCHFQCYDEEYKKKIETLKVDGSDEEFDLHLLLSKRTSTDVITGMLTGLSPEEIESEYLKMYESKNIVGPDVETLEQSKHQELESLNYDVAESIRREILKSTISYTEKILRSKITSRHKYYQKNNKFADDGRMLLPKSSVKLFDKLPVVDVDYMSNYFVEIRSKLYFDKLLRFLQLLNSQAKLINHWMSELILLLEKPLLTHDKTPVGDEYEQSIEDQDRVACYLHALSKILQNRKEAIEGKELTKVEIVRKGKDNLEIQVHDELFLRDLLENAEEYTIKSKTSLEGLVSEFKALEVEVKETTTNEHLKKAEDESFSYTGNIIRNVFSNQKLALLLFQKDLNSSCNAVFNARIEYFKQLQQISDSVKPQRFPFSQDCIDLKYISSSRDGILNRFSERSFNLSKTISKLRYLQTLAKNFDTKNTNLDDLICIICRSTITVGSLTQCGHKYCKECLELWLRTRSVCPMCKNRIDISTVYNFTHHKPDLKAKTEVSEIPRHVNEALFSIYMPMEDKEIEEVQSIQLKNSYSSKVDLIVKQVIHLRNKDPNVQIVIFSQWQDLLYIIGTAFMAANISFLGSYGTLTPEVGAGRRRNKYESVEKFKDPENKITCFLLNARAQASGLNLINATHIFLCEPLVNTTLELQAISRIHRIGQRKHTTVWVFIIENTVEESIMLMSTNKRLQYFNAEGRLKNSNNEQLIESSVVLSRTKEKNIAEAESMTLMQGEGIDTLINKSKSEGESVTNNDLWNAFFCARSNANEDKNNKLDT